MITVIRDVEVYSPEYLGKKNVVVVGNKFEGIYDEINIPSDFIEIKIIEGKGKLIFPGFIDAHVHILGGGGENGFSSRTPEIKFTDLTKAGITTVVGCLGTDDVCRDGRALLAKARALEIEGITSYCYTGSYSIPVKTVTNSIKEDIMLIDKYIGVGEVAISDNRSSQPAFEEFTRVVSQSRVAGLLSNKAGVVNIHVGDGSDKLNMIFKLKENTEIPVSQLLPTHINRNIDLFNEGIKLVKEGGFIDLTTSCDPDNMEEGEVRASKGLKMAYDLGADLNRITFSSDGNGSLPKFDSEGNLSGMGICSVFSLYEEVKIAIQEHKVPIESAIKVITSNIADVLKLDLKGRIESKKDADFVLVDKNELTVIDVYGKGEPLIENRAVIKKGIFE